MDEISACGDIYSRQHRTAGAFLFIRSLQKLIRRFDPSAFSVSETKERKIRDIITALEDGVNLIDPGSGRPEQAKLERTVKTCTKA